MSNYYDSMSYIDKKRKFESELPKELDQKLKDAYIAFSMLAPPFLWKKLKGGRHELKGFPECVLSVAQEGLVWNVTWKHKEGTDQVFSCLDFDEAFKAAKEFAMDNRREFLFSDREAGFKQKSISEKQLEIIKKAGFETGVDKLTSGQAGILMDCGVLRKKKDEVGNEPLPF